MNIKELLKKLFPDKSEEIELLETTETEKKTLEVKAEKPNTDIQEMKTLVNTLLAQNKELLDKVAANEKKDSERNALLENQAKTKLETDVETMVKKAIEDGRIPAKNEALINNFKNLLKVDFEGTKTIIENIPMQGKAKEAVATQQTQQVNGKSDFTRMLEGAANEIQAHLN